MNIIREITPYKLSNQTVVTICECTWAMIKLTNTNSCEGQTNKTEAILPPKRGGHDHLFCECIPLPNSPFQKYIPQCSLP